MGNFTGIGDAEECSAIVDVLMGYDVECLLPPCSFHGAHVSPIQNYKKFWGISNFFYIPNGLGILGWNEAKALTPKAIEDAAKSCVFEVALPAPLVRGGVLGLRLEFPGSDPLHRER